MSNPVVIMSLHPSHHDEFIGLILLLKIPLISVAKKHMFDFSSVSFCSPSTHTLYSWGPTVLFGDNVYDTLPSADLFAHTTMIFHE